MANPVSSADPGLVCPSKHEEWWQILRSSSTGKQQAASEMVVNGYLPELSRCNDVDSSGNPIISDQTVEVIKRELLRAAGFLEKVDPKRVAIGTSFEKNEKGKYELSVLLLAKDCQSDGTLAANPGKVIFEVQTVLETIPPPRGMK